MSPSNNSHNIRGSQWKPLEQEFLKRLSKQPGLQCRKGIEAVLFGRKFNPKSNDPQP